MPVRVGIGVEGATDYPVAEKLVRRVGRDPYEVLVARGKSTLDSRLSHWNQHSNRVPLLVLRDWDNDDRVQCAAELLSKLAPHGLQAPLLAVRIPVRSVESWLLADSEGFAEHFGTKPPLAPDDLEDPKAALVDACRRSRRGNVRKDMVPTPGSRRRVGPLYEANLIEFARERWDIDRGRANSPSLDRSLARLEQLVGDGVW